MLYKQVNLIIYSNYFFLVQEEHLARAKEEQSECKRTRTCHEATSNLNQQGVNPAHKDLRGER